MHVIKPDEERMTQERCAITELFNSAADPTCSIARARVAPGVTTQRHTLRGIAERYVIVAGQGQIEVGAEPPNEVRPPMVVYIPADTPQRITNTGTGDLVFLCVCTPRFVPEAYVADE